MSAASEDASSDAVLAWVDDLGAGDADARLGCHGRHVAGPLRLAGRVRGRDGRPRRGLRRLVGGGARRRPRHPGRVQRRRHDRRRHARRHRGAGRRPAAPGRRLPRADRRRRRGPRAVRRRPATLEVVVPEPIPPTGDAASRCAPSEELVFVVPSGAEAPVLRLDDGDTVVCGEAEGTELTDLEGSPVSAAPTSPRRRLRGRRRTPSRWPSWASDGDVDHRRVRPVRSRLGDRARGPKRRPSWTLVRAFTRLPRRVRDVLRSPPRLPHGGHLRAHRGRARGPPPGGRQPPATHPAAGREVHQLRVRRRSGRLRAGARARSATTSSPCSS